MNLTAEKYCIMIHFTISRNSQTHEAKHVLKSLKTILNLSYFIAKKK